MSHQPAASAPAGHNGSGKLGFVVFVILAVMTIVEYAIATELDFKMVPLIVIAFAKAVLILWYFMHVARAWLQSKGGAH